MLNKPLPPPPQVAVLPEVLLPQPHPSQPLCRKKVTLPLQTVLPLLPLLLHRTLRRLLAALLEPLAMQLRQQLRGSSTTLSKRPGRLTMAALHLRLTAALPLRQAAPVAAPDNSVVTMRYLLLWCCIAHTAVCAKSWRCTHDTASVACSHVLSNSFCDSSCTATVYPLLAIINSLRAVLVKQYLPLWARRPARPALYS
jgi:hypothetical protein